MEPYDHLSTLIDKFQLAVTRAPLKEANLVVLAAPDGTPNRALFRSQRVGFDLDGEEVLFSARVDWADPNNPLVWGLTATLDIDLSCESDGLVQIMQYEISETRDGGLSVLNRLGEVLIVRILRSQIELGGTQPGLLAGLSDPRLSKAIVAMHDQPGKAWLNEDLANMIGLSLSRFTETFFATVGVPPATYLRRWRLTQAQFDLIEGHKIELVARRYGYSSREGFTRAFRKHHGSTPISLRRRGNPR